MRMKLLPAVALVAVPLLTSSTSDYRAAVNKFSLIEHDRLRPGTRVDLTARELNAYVEEKVPDGVRNPHLDLGPGTATGSALIDFNRVRRAQGKPPSLLMSYLLEGEHPVTVTARIHSAGGTATVDVQSVEISGITIQGRMLDFVIHNYLQSIFPDAKVGQPFALSHHMERWDVQPSAVGVIIGR